MRDIEIGVGVVVRIPDCWTEFMFRGLLYVRDEHGHFVVQSVNVPRGTPATTRPSQQ